MKVEYRQRVIAVAAAAGALLVEASFAGRLRRMHGTLERNGQGRRPLRARPSRRVEPAPYSVKRHV